MRGPGRECWRSLPVGPLPFPPHRLTAAGRGSHD
nr:MAG TPA: Mandelate racemase/muconate lactonizing enzyme, RACEMASE, STRUCTURAL GENOMICS, PSI-2.7A [Caudoviricetes sp.]